MGRFAAALAVVALALVAATSGVEAQNTPYEWVSAQPDMTLFKTCLDHLTKKNQNPWFAKKSLDLTLFAVTDAAFVETFNAYGFNRTNRITEDIIKAWCTNIKTRKANMTRNTVIKYHILEGARTIAQLPAGCPVTDLNPGGYCAYTTTAAGKKGLRDVIWVGDDDVSTYVMGALNADKLAYGDVYGDWETERSDVKIAGRVIHTISLFLMQNRYIPKGDLPSSPSPTPSPGVSPTPSPSPTPSDGPASPPSPPPPSPPPPSPPPPSPPPPNPPPPSPPTSPGFSIPPPSPPPPSPAPPPSPYTGFYSIWDFVSQRVIDLRQTRAAIYGADMDEFFNNPEIAATCFFPDDSSNWWSVGYPPAAPAYVPISEATAAAVNCWNLINAGNVTGAGQLGCRSTILTYQGFMRNNLLQWCIPSAAPVGLLTTANPLNWPNGSFLATMQNWAFVYAYQSGDTFWVTTSQNGPAAVSASVLANTATVRKRDNLVARSIVQVTIGTPGVAATAPPPPPPPSPTPPAPSPPPPVYLDIVTALNLQSSLSVTRQLVANTLLNVTHLFRAENGMRQTTCYFPSNVAWYYFSQDVVDRGQFVITGNNGTGNPWAGRRRLSIDEVPEKFCIFEVCFKQVPESRRRLQTQIPNIVDGNMFIDHLSWTVVLQNTTNSLTLELLRKTLLQSCYAPPAPGGASVARPLATTGGPGDFTYPTAAYPGRDATGIRIVRSNLFTGTCTNGTQPVSMPTGTVPAEVVDVNLFEMGYCSQCANAVLDDTQPSRPIVGYNGCSFYVYVLFTAGASGVETQINNNAFYTRGRFPVIYWLPHDIVAGDSYIQLVDRIVQSPVLPPPPPSPLPPSPPPAPSPPPPFPLGANSLKEILNRTPGFNSCAAVLFNQYNYYPVVENFATSGYTLFVPSDDGCWRTCQNRYPGAFANLAACVQALITGSAIPAIPSGTGFSIVRNMFVPQADLPTARLIENGNTTRVATNLGLLFDGLLTTLVTGSGNVRTITILQNFAGYPEQSAAVGPFIDIPVDRPAGHPFGQGRGGWLQQTQTMLYPELQPPSPPPPPPAMPSPPLPPSPPPPPAYPGGFLDYLKNNGDNLNVFASLCSCTFFDVYMDRLLNNTGNAATILAPTDTAFTQWFAANGLPTNDLPTALSVLCSPARNATTFALLQAHVVNGAQPTWLILQNSQAGQYLIYNYFFGPTVAGLTNYKLFMNATNSSLVIRVPSPPVSANLVAGRYDTILFSNVSRPNTAYSVAHMITSVLSFPAPAPPSPPPPPPPGSNRTSVGDYILTSGLTPIYTTLLNLQVPNSSVAFQSYLALLSNQFSLFTVLTISDAGIAATLARYTVNGVPIQWGECFVPASPQNVICTSLIANSILPNIDFLPSFAAPGTGPYNMTIDTSGKKFAAVGTKSSANAASNLYYFLDTATSPPPTTSLQFRTYTDCSAPALTTSGPTPVGIVLGSGQRSNVYLVNGGFVNSEAVAAANALGKGTVAVTPAAGCIP
ncbi:hypothetical protein HYH03_003467 [Edaphochlamys debaryana]|uniref:FAS1 domain-containing protein n=1 Tax=Edaphochlamys debaryana TaxID=47281 RepID=A0A835YBY3_9CHLO|nr:hypothetical protein HYH03_003467 [Edaphochlamys debaryana]|eukprot:KAG2498727.1 hypothetical protein HYH03_003467 [Edaphochlamys debaryana]